LNFRIEILTPQFLAKGLAATRARRVWWKKFAAAEWRVSLPASRGSTTRAKNTANTVFQKELVAQNLLQSCPLRISARCGKPA
jgi:hypothetical protein